jgi:hypothetical protein
LEDIGPRRRKINPMNIEKREKIRSKKQKTRSKSTITRSKLKLEKYKGPITRSKRKKLLIRGSKKHIPEIPPDMEGRNE